MRSSLVDGSLPDDYLDGHVISLWDEHWVALLPVEPDSRRKSYMKTFALGEARAVVSEGLDTPVAGRRVVRISIESPNTTDFAALYNHIYRDWLGIPHEDIPVPERRFQEPSFVRGIRNDLRDLRQFFKNRWCRARAMIADKFA